MRRILAVAALAAFLPAQHQTPDAASHKTVVDAAVAAGSFQTLVAAVKAAGLVETLSGKGPFTVFAPTDAAFAQLGKDALADLLKPENKARLTAILTYHVAAADLPAAKVVAAKSIATVQGQPLAVAVAKDTVRVGGATVVKTDIRAGNGVIHVIDAVLVPPNDIVAVARQAGSFGTLLQAAAAAGLADTLAGKGPFTVFAPTDAAFAKVDQAVLASLLEPENKAKLVKLLQYHVVPGKVPAAAAMKLSAASTLLGRDLALTVQGGKLRVDEATVTQADVAADNGVIHVIDRVLMPKEW